MSLRRAYLTYYALAAIVKLFMKHELINSTNTLFLLQFSENKIVDIGDKHTEKNIPTNETIIQNILYNISFRSICISSLKILFYSLHLFEIKY